MSSKNDKAEESSQSKNLKISLDRSLLLSNHDFEKPNEHLIQQEESINFNSDKKNETVSMDSNSSLEVHFADDNNSPVEFAIKTNLTHVGKTEELNELVSLVNIHRPESSKINDQEHQIDDSKTEIITKSFPLENKKEEPELVPIDGNLTVVSEKELAEGQVEITASMPNKKPVTLMNFSMDFSDDSSDASFEVFKKEKIMGIAESLYSSKNYEDDFKELTAGGDCKVDDILSNESTVTNKVEIGNTSSELISNIEIEHTLENTITTKIELNKDAKTEIKVEENQNVGESLKVEESNKTAVKINESSSETKMLQLTGNSQANELIHLSIPPLRGIIKAPNQMPVKDKTKECDKIENSHLKKIDRKSTHLVNVDNTVSNEPLVIYNTAKSSTVTDMCDLEDHIPSQIVCAKNALMNEEVMKVAGISNELKECSLRKQNHQCQNCLVD
ncbi:hypothetical protein HHI36_017122 [Cryptolaemus montrouzieri]|uniref:Uncharacterized protein n=1 Tax=Cryptolaemus montrouzieri TaxID=559131 RepID=A0ABD2NLJ8_9CUCU